MQHLPSRLLLFVIAILLFTGLVVAQSRPTSSVPTSALGVVSGLAAYAPSNSLFYISSRTDKESIAALNSVMSGFESNSPESTSFGSIEDTLGTMIGAPFSEMTGWLGDGIAVAGLRPEDAPQASPAAPYNIADLERVYILHVKDTAAAEAFLRQHGITSFATDKDVLLFSDSGTALALDDRAAATLLTEPAYHAAIEAFDAHEYKALIYADLPLLMPEAADTTRQASRSPLVNQPQTLLETALSLQSSGPVTAGLTQDAQNRLVMDIAVADENLNGTTVMRFSLNRSDATAPQAALGAATASPSTDSGAGITVMLLPESTEEPAPVDSAKLTAMAMYYQTPLVWRPSPTGFITTPTPPCMTSGQRVALDRGDSLATYVALVTATLPPEVTLEPGPTRVYQFPPCEATAEPTLTPLDPALLTATWDMNNLTATWDQAFTLTAAVQLSQTPIPTSTPFVLPPETTAEPTPFDPALLTATWDMNNLTATWDQAYTLTAAALYYQTPLGWVPTPTGFMTPTPPCGTMTSGQRVALDRSDSLATYVALQTTTLPPEVTLESGPTRVYEFPPCEATTTP